MLLYVTFPQRLSGWGFIVQPTHMMPLFHRLKKQQAIAHCSQNQTQLGVHMPQNWVHWWAAQTGIWNLQSQSLVQLAKDSTDLQGLWGLPPSRKTCKRLLCCCPAGLWIASTFFNFDLFQAGEIPPSGVHQPFHRPNREFLSFKCFMPRVL